MFFLPSLVFFFFFRFWLLGVLAFRLPVGFASWLSLGACQRLRWTPRGSCSLPVAVDLAPALTEAQAALQANKSKLEAGAWQGSFLSVG